MNDSLKVSIVVATHNRAGFLPALVNSFLHQDLQESEIIVVNDASSDHTEEIMRDIVLREPQRVRTVNLSHNVGPGAARNAGMARATGEYIAIQDDDDEFLAERFVSQCKFLDNNPRVGLTFSPVVWVDESGSEIGIFSGVARNGTFPCDSDDAFCLLYLESNKIPNTTVMLRHSIYDVMSGYPEQPWIGEDWYWFMQMAASGVQMKSLTTPLVRQQRGRTHSNLMADKKCAFRAQRQVLRMIRVWLEKQQITQFDYLHRKALSNQLVREARFLSGIRGLLLCQRALILSPRNELARKAIRDIFGKIPRKVDRAFSS